jgi:hypothetical protein
MLVMRRAYEGPDGTEIFALDESRSAATTLSGLALIKEWTTSPLSELILNRGSLMRTCCRLPVGSGMHVDPFSSEMADLASPVERRRHHAGGLKSIYMLHAEEDLVVQFASWVPGAFEGMEAELLEYTEEHLLRSSNSVSAKHMAHLTGVDISGELIRLRQSPTTPQSPYDLHGMDDMWPSDSMIRRDHFSTSAQSQCETDDSWPADSVSTESSTLSSGLLSLAASMVEGFEVSRSARRSKDADAAIGVVSAMPLDQLSQIVPAVLLAIPAGNVIELEPAILEAVSPQRIPVVLPGIHKLQLPDVMQDVVSTVVEALPADELPELTAAILLAVPPKPIANRLQGALKPRKVAFEEFDSGWGTLQMGVMNSAVCSGELTVERMDPFEPEDSAEKSHEAPCDLPGRQE